jgi:hypothetical protein
MSLNLYANVLLSFEKPIELSTFAQILEIDEKNYHKNARAD